MPAGRKGRAALLREIVREYRSGDAACRRAIRQAFAFDVVCSDRYWELIEAERAALHDGLEERVWALSREAKKEHRFEGNPDLIRCLETHRLKAFRRFEKTGSAEALRDFLAAWTITNGSGDVRDDMLLLPHIEEIAVGRTILPLRLVLEPGRVAPDRR